MASQSAPTSSRICFSAAVALMLLSAGVAQAGQHAAEPSGSPDSMQKGMYMAPCDRTLRFTDVASKPCLKCTDFAPVFNLYELEPEPAEDDYRPTIEVNYYNRLFKTLETPAEDNFYGFTQGKCHTTIMTPDGTVSKVECAQTITDSTGKSFAAQGVFDMATGGATYAILGGLGEYMGAYGEAHVTYEAAPESVLGETADMYRYEVCLSTPAVKGK